MLDLTDAKHAMRDWADQFNSREALNTMLLMAILLELRANAANRKEALARWKPEVPPQAPAAGNGAAHD